MKRPLHLKIFNYLPLLISGFVFIFAWAIQHADIFGICHIKNLPTYGNTWVCLFGNYRDLNIWGDVLMTLSLFVLVISIFVILLRKDVMNRWLKFVAVWLPLTIVLVALAENNSTQALPYDAWFTKGAVAFEMGVLFAVISSILILWQTFRKPKVQK